MSESPASTPMVLTPDSTGSSDTSTSGHKKTRRQPAYYPNLKSPSKPQKPFSRSAAKRESVMALGSIEHLQHYFTKTGLTPPSDPNTRSKKGLVPALGGLTTLRTDPATLPRPPSELPPTPAIPSPPRPSFPTFVKTYETDPYTLRLGVIDDLSSVSRAWNFDDTQPSHSDDRALLGVGSPPKGSTPSNFDVLGVLKNTTHLVRSVRNYLVSLPDDSIGRIRDEFRPRATPSKPIVKRQSSPGKGLDPLALIRRSALEVLAVLRELEESSRVPLSDEAYDVQSEHGSSSGTGSHSRGASPSAPFDELDRDDGDTSFAFSLVKVRGREESIPVWEDDSYDNMNDSTEEDGDRREHWDERLVLGGGWLYRQDIRLDDLVKEQEVVRKYLDTVDDVLFGGTKDGQRGWDRERAAERAKGRRASSGDTEARESIDGSRRVSNRRVVSTGLLDSMKDMVVTEEPEEMETLGEEGEESFEDEDLPLWARRSSFPGDPLGRVHAFLSATLPPDLVAALPPSATDRIAFLQALSSGQLLCVAYNTAVRQSRKPWGFINKPEIHDLITMESSAGPDEKDDKTKTGWTYRRLDNLRLWSGGLKIRYMLPIVILPKPPTPLNVPQSHQTPLTSPSASTYRFPPIDPPFEFNTRTVAMKDEGWEGMLETSVINWTMAVAEERRGER
ncbi:hypothetical protein JAAARDRAFT_184027 [Jaapia argillacea MUCL 33604]|uniref:Uncharacterized protein n=1 Tax=Jaapia argillacea MUCL 33604 TaxID=933084 RepID=A0A067PQ79_9AGAM|nr:hypothetical protein JAAARDRAFT_184027 [Jaapia argillacea MUCL 33604]